MSTVELSEEDFDAACCEARRRGVDVSEVVAEAVQRFVVGSDLRNLLEELHQQDTIDPGALTDEDAMRIANEELRAARASRAAVDGL